MAAICRLVLQKARTRACDQGAVQITPITSQLGCPSQTLHLQMPVAQQLASSTQIG